jgi:hypothetical protein
MRSLALGALLAALVFAVPALAENDFTQPDQTFTSNVFVKGTLKSGASGTLAQGFTSGGFVLPICATGAPTGAAANGNLVIGGDNNVWARVNGAWLRVNAAGGGGGTPGWDSVLATTASTGSHTPILSNTVQTDAVGSHVLQINSCEYESQPFFWNVEQHTFPGGPRPDVIYSWGYNMDPNDVPAVLGEPAAGFVIETYYNTGPSEFVESYWVYNDKGGGSPGQHRFLAFQVDRNSNTAGFDSAFGFLKRLGIGDQSGNTPFEFDMGLAQTPTLTLNSQGTTTARFLNITNNAPWLLQYNAAGNGTIELVRIDSSNNVVVGPDGTQAGIKLNGATTCTSTVTASSFGGTGDTTFKAGTSGNIVHISAGATVIADFSTSYELLSAPLLDGTNNGHDIGSAANAFKDLYLGGTLKRYGAVATAGNGLPSIMSSGRNAAVNAAAQTVINAFAVPAADTTYELNVNVLITTLGSGSFTVTCTYTDEGNTARTMTIPFINTAGATVTTLAAAAPFATPDIRIRCKASSTISVQSVAGTFTGCTYNIEASLKKIS